MIHSPQHVYVFNRAGVRALDRAAIDELHIPGIVLMENAAIAAAQLCLNFIRERAITRIGIVCGPGNNGGDGLALARHLGNRGLNPLIALTVPAQRYQGDAAANLLICEAMGLRILDPIASMSPQVALEILYSDGRDHTPDREPSDVLLVDAMLGTGADRPIGPPMSQAVAWINGLRARGASVIAVDIPSGLDCDTGLPLGDAVVRADATITLAGMKKGLLEPDASPYCGTLYVGDIGVPDALLKRFAIGPSPHALL